MSENEVRYWIAGVCVTLAIVGSAILYFLPDQPPTIEGWSHATQIVAKGMMDPIALYEDNNTCRQVFVGWTDFHTDTYHLLHRDPTKTVNMANRSNGTVSTNWKLINTHINQDVVNELNGNFASPTIWFANATTVAMIGQRTDSHAGDMMLRFLDLHSGYIQTINLRAKIGLLDDTVLYCSPWNCQVAIADNYDKTVYLLDMRKNAGQWRVSATKLADSTRYKITAVAISPDGKVVYCLDNAYEPVVLKWRVGASKRWERVGKNDYSLDGGYVGNIAVDKQGNIACVRYVYKNISADGVHLDRFNPRGERKTTDITSKTDTSDVSVAFTRNGDSACILTRSLEDEGSRFYLANFIGSTSVRNTPDYCTLIPGKGAYLLCRYVGRRSHRTGILYEID